MLREHLPPRQTMPRHRHARGYTAVVLSGSYMEAGDEGRRRVQAGDALVHGAFDAHSNSIGAAGAQILNVQLFGAFPLPAAFRVRDLDALARAAERGVVETAALLEMVGDAVPLLDDWPDRLATALRSEPALRLDRWASQMGFAPATVSRGFRAAFGVSPIRYRADARARRAFERIVIGEETLASIAHDCGFADQPHLSRAISELTGISPAAWRRSNRFKTRAMHRP